MESVAIFFGVICHYVMFNFLTKPNMKNLQSEVIRLRVSIIMYVVWVVIFGDAAFFIGIFLNMLFFEIPFIERKFKNG